MMKCVNCKYEANIRICPQIFVFAFIYPYLSPNSTSGICAVVSKYKETKGNVTFCHHLASSSVVCHPLTFHIFIFSSKTTFIYGRSSINGISVFALKYSYLPSYIRICPLIQLPVSAQWSQSTRKDDAWKYV
jgi:hypothetical protein